MAKEASPKIDAMRKQREEQYARRQSAGRGGSAVASPTKPDPSPPPAEEPVGTVERAASSKPSRQTGGALAAARTSLSHATTGGRPRCPACGKKVPVENGKIGVHKANMRLCSGSRQEVPK